MRILKPTAGLVLGLALALVACHPAGAQDNKAPGAPPVTFEEVVKLLRTGKSEKDILDTLGRSPIDVNFVLGEIQVDELRKMRVTDEFLTELRNLGMKKPAFAAGDVTDLVLILDCSGSMTDRTKDGAVKMDAAKQAVTDLIRDFPAGRRLAFIVYGHDKKRECQAVDVVRPLGPLGTLAKDELLRYIGKLQPVGHTPIARALEAAAGELAKAKGLSKVVLITDGIETCHGDPVKAAAALVEKAKADVDVIGFVLKPEEGLAVDRIAKAGRGKYYDAQTVENLRKDLQQVAQAPVQPKKPVEPVVVKKEEPPADLSPVEKALVESLTDKGEHYEHMLVRKQAADSLRERNATAAVPFLVKRVADDVWYGTGDDVSKDAALAALRELAPDRVQDALVAATKAKNARVKAWAAKKLAAKDN
jgi:von Willebrand factor type A domain